MACAHSNERQWPNNTLLTYTLPADGQGEGERGRWVAEKRMTESETDWVLTAMKICWIVAIPGTLVAAYAFFSRNSRAERWQTVLWTLAAIALFNTFVLSHPMGRPLLPFEIPPPVSSVRGSRSFGLSSLATAASEMSTPWARKEPNQAFEATVDTAPQG